MFILNFEFEIHLEIQLDCYKILLDWIDIHLVKIDGL